MDIKDILAKVDHTLLLQTATKQDIMKICDEGKKYGVASVCIPPSFVKFACDYSKGAVKICTVIGFPNGYSTTLSKCFEANNAIKNGADEIDMVINLGWVKDQLYDDILDEINKVKESCEGRILKVIIETCLLSDDEKIKLCEIVSKSNADFIKTSTGFSSAGATAHDIKLFKEHIFGNTLIKAAGGISTIDDAKEFLALGADRLGTSKIVKIAKENNLV